MAASRHHVCGDTLNIFRHGDQHFFFKFKVLVTCYGEKYILNQQIVHTGNHFQISLSSKLFRKMLTLPNPMPTFKGDNRKIFLKKHGNELDLLSNLLQEPTLAPQDMAILQVSACKNLFRQIAFIFMRTTIQASATGISHMHLYILYFTVKQETIFHCPKLISIQKSSQLLQYRR